MLANSLQDRMKKLYMMVIKNYNLRKAVLLLTPPRQCLRRNGQQTIKQVACKPSLGKRNNPEEALCLCAGQVPIDQCVDCASQMCIYSATLTVLVLVVVRSFRTYFDTDHETFLVVQVYVPGSALSTVSDYQNNGQGGCRSRTPGTLPSTPLRFCT